LDKTASLFLRQNSGARRRPVYPEVICFSLLKTKELPGKPPKFRGMPKYCRRLWQTREKEIKAVSKYIFGFFSRN
jgi:hypothetical protein